jgi:hypothetical protein
VKRYRGYSQPPVTYWHFPATYPDEPRSRAVTARADELARAGWTTLGEDRYPSLYTGRPLVLTDAGRAVLAAHPEETDV